MALAHLGSVAIDRGDAQRAARLCEESLALWQELGDTWGIAGALLPLAQVAVEQGDSALAAALYQESLTLYPGMGDRVGMAAGLEGMARVACAEGQLERAARLLGAAEALREAIGVPLPSPERAAHERAVAGVHLSQPDDTCATAWAAGRALPLEHAIGEALETESRLHMADG